MPILPSFEELSKLRIGLAAIKQSHSRTLAQYVSRDNKGFYHQLKSRQNASRSSTATCVSSLVHAGLWTDNFVLWQHTGAVAAKLVETPWTSAELEPNNPFSVSFIIEGVLDLQESNPQYDASTSHRSLIQEEIAPILVRALDKGYISIDPYPASAYLTQLAYRVLNRLDLNTPEIDKNVQIWARHEVNRQIALISAHSRIADPLQLAYALILATATASDERTSPEDKQIYDHALELFFREQTEAGGWRPSQPLFHYPTVGNAYCFDYELLTQLLSSPALRYDLLPYIPYFAKSVHALSRKRFDLEKSRPGYLVAWASGHHPQIEGPESWSTASVYHFANALDRLVAEGLRRTVFSELNAIYRPPIDRTNERPKFASDFLDAHITRNGGSKQSLRETIERVFVAPLAAEAHNIERGGSFAKTTAMSAILYGPPGTSKTQLAVKISDYIGWPLVSVDPSYIVQEGLDRIQAMANRLFNMLTVVEQVVVLLDEFDEMGRDRSRSNELLSRFITTAMLPKLASINEQRKIVFLLATNFVSSFDAAFSRGGRFDMLLQVMPPHAEAKKQKWSNLSEAIDVLDDEEKLEYDERLSDLTFAEVSALARLVGEDRNPDNIKGKFDAIWESCTLKKKNDIGLEIDNEDINSRDARLKQYDATSWKKTSLAERSLMRLPSN